MRPPVLRISSDELIVDNFAGGGGASTGISWALGRSPDIAVNHDPEALALHKANHPTTRHLCEDVFDVDPVKVCAGGAVGLAWFSPDCTRPAPALSVSRAVTAGWSRTAAVRLRYGKARAAAIQGSTDTSRQVSGR